MRLQGERKHTKHMNREKTREREKACYNHKTRFVCWLAFLLLLHFYSTQDLPALYVFLAKGQSKKKCPQEDGFVCMCKDHALLQLEERGRKIYLSGCVAPSIYLSWIKSHLSYRGFMHT